ncbi:MAG TPA: hypothetical protein VD970_08775 [Acetobacteraceae bacterium]|nr:hypothetical protein [Acetobacteraceae bacterium]
MPARWTRPWLAGAALATGLAACGTPAPPLAPPGARPAALPPGSCEGRFTLTNRTPTSIAEFYFRPAGGSGWGLDRLGNRTLTRGQSISFRVSGEGRHDVRVVFANDRAAELMNINLCEVPLLAAEERGLVAR